MRRTSSRERSVTGEHYAGDHRVPQLTGASSLVPSSHEVCRFFGGSRIERSNPPSNFVGEDRLESSHQ